MSDEHSPVEAICEDIRNHTPLAVMSVRFHLGLVEGLVEACRLIRDESGISTVALSGGCFQNRFLLSRVTDSLAGNGFEVLTHSQVPSNDGGICLGQAAVAAQRLIKKL